jgi:hypothetical protein
MTIVSCRECNQAVSTEADTCPHCGEPQIQVQGPLAGQPPAVPSKEATIYSDNTVLVTDLRIKVGGTTYALRNITSVRMAVTPPRMVKPVLLLVVGLIILFAALVPITDIAPAPIGVYIIGGGMILGAILWMIGSKTKYHVAISSAASEVHVLTSNNRTYIQKIVESVNKAIVENH